MCLAILSIAGPKEGMHSQGEMWICASERLAGPGILFLFQFFLSWTPLSTSCNSNPVLGDGGVVHLFPKHLQPRGQNREWGVVLLEGRKHNPHAQSA